MSVQELIDGYKKANPDGHFFDDDTLAYFGEYVNEMSVEDDPDDYDLVILHTFQRNAPAGTSKCRHYRFNRHTFEQQL